MRICRFQSPVFIPEKKHIIRFPCLVCFHRCHRCICSSIGSGCLYEICFSGRIGIQKICNRKLIKPTVAALSTLCQIALGNSVFLQIRFLIYRYINRISIFHRSHPRILSQKFRNLRIIPCGIFWHQKYYHDNNCSSRNTTANRHNLSDHPVSARFFFPGGCRYSIYIFNRILSGCIAKYKCTDDKNKNNHCQQTGDFLPGPLPAAKQQMIDQTCCSA